MSIAVERIGGVENRPNHPRRAASQTIDCKSMLAEYNVAGFICWRMAPSESMEIVQVSAEVDASFRTRSAELAEVAVRTGQRQSCILASPRASIFIAELIPESDRDCLCVHFFCDMGELNQKAIDQRIAVVAKFASAISTVSPSLGQPVPAPVNHPSWSELARMTKHKLLKSFEEGKSNSKAIFATILAVGSVILIPWPHSIRCEVVCEPVLRRYVAAPFDARLLQSHVVVGQHVEQGELLATLDGGELRSQVASIRAKLSQAEQRELAALSSGDHSKSGFERLEVEHLRRETELLERRQAGLEIRSPIEGVVVTGDLERAEGAPLSVGDNLFEIASLDKLIAEVAIPEQDILFVKDEMPVSIVFDAIPGSNLKSKIQRIHLRNEIRNDKSVFIAEAEMANKEYLLRPGMHAKATIDAGYRAIGWQLLRRPYNATREWFGW